MAAALCVAALALSLTLPQPAEADTGVLRLDSPAGDRVEPTPLVITGWADPDRSWSSVTVTLDIDESLVFDVVPGIDGRFSLRHDPLGTLWTSDSGRITLAGIEAGTGERHEVNRSIELDTTRLDDHRVDVEWEVEGGFDEAILPLSVSVTVTDIGPSDLELLVESATGRHLGIETRSVTIDPGPHGADPQTERTTHVFGFAAADFAAFDGGDLLLHLEVKDRSDGTVRRFRQRVTTVFGHDDAAGIQLDSPAPDARDLSYPIIVSGTVRPGPGIALDPATQLAVTVWSGPNGTPAFDVTSRWIDLDPNGQFRLEVDPRFTHGWVWDPNDQFTFEFDIVHPDPTRTSDIPSEVPHRVTGERVDRYCHGYGVTVDLASGERPTSNADVILGTPLKDTIKAGAGDDIVCGGGGRDVISGGPGRDLIDGGIGKDVIKGGAGQDAIFAGEQSDKVFAGRGNDYVEGGGGDDRIMLGGGDDVAYGGAGDDALFGLAGEDWLQGEDGNDRLVGGGGPDHLAGGSGVNWGAAGGGSDECLDGTFSGCEIWPIGR